MIDACGLSNCSVFFVFKDNCGLEATLSVAKDCSEDGDDNGEFSLVLKS